MNGKAILLAGGTRGIGRACALELASHGHRLNLGYARDHEAASLVKAEAEALGGECLLVCADTTTDGCINALFDAAIDWAPQLDGVVNSAGATLHVGPWSTHL